MTNRLQKLQQIITEKHCDGILVTSPFNVYFLTGIKGNSGDAKIGWLLVLPDKVYFFTSALFYYELLTQNLPLELVLLTPEKRLTSHLNAILKPHTQIFFEGNSLLYQEATLLQKQLSTINWTTDDTLLTALRIKKDPEEIASIQTACEITTRVWTMVKDAIIPGKTEKQVAWEIEKAVREQADDIAWRPLIVAAGPHSAYPHHIPTDYQIKKNDVIQIDFGILHNQYNSDFSRIILPQNPESKVLKAYEAVQQTLTNIENTIKNGVSAKELDNNARKILQKTGFSKEIYAHGLGHGIGLEVHEAPHLSYLSKDTIEDTMCFAIEPALYFQNEFGIRLENTYYLENNQLINLTKD